MFKKPLPAKGNFAQIWQKITKGGKADMKIIFIKICLVIDDLHVRNHVETCKVKWNPNQIRDIYPNANLVCCEQTFAWLGSTFVLLVTLQVVIWYFQEGTRRF